MAKKQLPEYCSSVNVLQDLLKSTEKNIALDVKKSSKELLDLEGIDLLRGAKESFMKQKAMQEGNLETVKKATAVVDLANNKLCVPGKARTKVVCDDFLITKQAIMLAPSGEKKQSLSIAAAMENDICNIKPKSK